MSKIRILPEHLANQIAAGEVVERPASVVKELIENSLDAGATRIEVEIEGGGARLMRIIDNGCGMVEDDLLMSLERHGTSKIIEQEDLEAIETLGFRGEALPSIGSVAKLTLISRTAESKLGTQVVLDYGKLVKVHETGCGIGTTVEVRRLFGNIPARRKFLRTTRTEQGHIEEVVKNYALGCPEVSFTLRIDGRESLQFDARMNLAQRLMRIMRYQGEFITIDSQLNRGHELERRLKGYLVPPEISTAGPARLRLFVNGRAVRDRLMIHAITEGLRGFLLKGKNPSGMIMLTVNPVETDVNVHPAKHEIRFRNAGDIHAFLVEAVVQAMHSQQRKLQSQIFQISKRESSQPTVTARKEISTVTEKDFPPTPRPSNKSQPAAVWSSPVQRAQLPQNLGQSSLQAETSDSSKEVAENQPHFQAGQKEESARSHTLRIIGVFDDLYIFCQGSEGLVVIDQHAAHERLLYEKLRRQYLRGKVIRQTLLFPETVELSLFQTQLLEKNREELERIGFNLRDFGGNTFVVSAMPAMAKTTSGRELLLDVLEQFGSEEGNRSSKEGDLLDNILATMACKAAVKANTSLSHLEIESLLNDMAEANLFSHCPHGRPAIKTFSKDDIKKWFYRT